MAPSVLLQQLAALARQDELRFEVDGKSTLTFQVHCQKFPPCSWWLFYKHSR